MKVRTRIWLLGVLAAGSLLVALATLLATEFAQLRQAQRGIARFDTAKVLSVVANELQAERGLSVGFLASSDGEEALRDQHLRVDAAYLDAGALLPEYAARPASIDQLRALTLARRLSAGDAYAGYTTAVSSVMDDLLAIALGEEQGGSQQRLYAFVSLMQAKEYLGQARAAKLQALTAPSDDMQWLVALSQRLALFDDRLRRFEANADDESRQALTGEALLRSLQETRRLIAVTLAHASVDTDGNGQTAQQWFEIASDAVNALHRLDLQMLERMSKAVTEQADKIRKGMLLKAAVLLLLWSGLMVLTFTLLRQLLIWLGTLLDNLRLARGSAGVDSGDDEQGRALVGAFRTLIDRVDRLNIEAVSDPLTGLYNRRGLTRAAEIEIQRAQRYDRQLSLLMVDVDWFKRINDTHGHSTGDRVLLELAALLQQRARISDLIGRWGGEEFVLVLSETDLPQALQLAEQLRSQVQAHRFGALPPLTISIGVAELEPGDTLDDLCARADRALYRAKEAGRNCIREDSVESPEIPVGLEIVR